MDWRPLEKLRLSLVKGRSELIWNLIAVEKRPRLLQPPLMISVMRSGIDMEVRAGLLLAVRESRKLEGKFGSFPT